MLFIYKVKFFYSELLKKSTFRNFLAVSVSSFALKPIAFIREFFVAKYLNPESYGILKSLEMIQMLNKFGSLGFNATASREAGHLNGENQFLKAERLKSVAYTSELILTTILFLIGTAYGFLFQKQIAIYIFLASSGLFALKISGIYDTEAVIRKSFTKYSQVTFITGVIVSAFVICFVSGWGVTAVLMGSVVSGFVTIALYIFWLKYNLIWSFDRGIFKQILKVSIPLSFGTISYGIYKYSERILILAHLNTISLGFFGFAETISNSFLIFIKTFIKVRTQDLYEYLGQRKYRDVHRIVLRETFYLSVASILIIPIVYLGAKFLIPVLLPNWIDGIAFVNLFMFMLFVQALPNHVFIVISSSVVNKQLYIPFARFLSLGVLYILVYASLFFGELDLKIYIIIDLFANLIYAIVLLILYKIFFVNKFVKLGGQ